MYREVALFMGDHGVDNIHLTVIYAYAYQNVRRLRCTCGTSDGIQKRIMQCHWALA
jgi:hypothetical protein